jgi:hypothetical protein
MVARSGSLPTSGGYAYELKWDGFRGLLSTEGRLRIVSRRGWDMTPLIPELATFPVFGTFDGELVAFDEYGSPDFPLICERVLNRHQEIRLTYVIFDLLTLNGESWMHLPYSERRSRLEALELNGTYWQTPGTFEDGEALFEAVCERELEGIVAKRLSGRYTRDSAARGSRSRTATNGATRLSVSRRSTSRASVCSSNSASLRSHRRFRRAWLNAAASARLRTRASACAVARFRSVRFRSAANTSASTGLRRPGDRSRRHRQVRARVDHSARCARRRVALEAAQRPARMPATRAARATPGWTPPRR